MFTVEHVSNNSQSFGMGALDCWNAISTWQVSRCAAGSNEDADEFTLGGEYGATEPLLLPLHSSDDCVRNCDSSPLLLETARISLKRGSYTFEIPTVLRYLYHLRS